MHDSSWNGCHLAACPLSRSFQIVLNSMAPAEQHRWPLSAAHLPTVSFQPAFFTCEDLSS